MNIKIKLTKEEAKHTSMEYLKEEIEDIIRNITPRVCKNKYCITGSVSNNDGDLTLLLTTCADCPLNKIEIEVEK